jgi:hypothetical protein
MSFSVWLDWNKPLTSLVYPPPGRKVPKGLIPLANLPDTYYTTGEVTSKPLAFPTRKDAQQVADLIKNASVQQDEDC